MFSKSSKQKLAALLLVLMVHNIVAPTVSWALTSGPSMPEYSSFEPADASDMVNLLTGDFTYNLPLLEVPSPEGGYPISLSYHGGIRPHQEASWVGLGWTLNPGAITRSVNGYPDDHLNVTREIYDWWEGGQSESFSMGIGIPLGQTGISLGLMYGYSEDTYQGKGGVLGLSVNYGFPQSQIGVGVGVNAGWGSMQNASGIGLNASLAFLNASYNSNGEFSVGASFRGLASMGVSTSSGVSFSHAGYQSGGLDNNVGNTQLSTNTDGSWGLNLILLNIGTQKTRYWVDNITSINTVGSLHANGITSQTSGTKSFDGNVIGKIGGAYEDYVEPRRGHGGVSPSFDSYMVTAHGMKGLMKPYLFEDGSISTKTAYNIDGSYTYDVPLTSFSQRAQFRFVGELSNNNELSTPQSIDYTNVQNNSFRPGVSQIPVVQTRVFSQGAEGFNQTTKQLAGGKHPIYFLNSEITTSSSSLTTNGYLKPLNYLPPIDNAKASQIGAFKVANDNGMQYHYGIPVYSFNQVNENRYDENPNTAAIEQNTNGASYHRMVDNTPYAYSWLLTTITGPDYVDRNGDNIANEGDWGYWVNFDYGKWEDNYNWRLPYSGVNRDISANNTFFSQGEKEIYYLNSIKTRTHTAIFMKEIRKDGCSTTDQKLLKLNKIFLVKNENLPFVSAPLSCFGNNYVIDFNGISSADAEICLRPIIQRASRIIEFESDYSLCKNIPNNTNHIVGKLTLKAVTFKGLAGAHLVPPTSFNYEVEDPSVGAAEISPLPNNTTGLPIGIISVPQTNQAILQEGDLLRTDDFNHYQVLEQLPNNGSHRTFKVLAFGENNFPYVPGYMRQENFTKTKNPPYNPENYDYWGYYKSDFILQEKNKSQSNFTRIPSEASVKSNDVWSLRSITNGLGAKTTIEYKPKKIDKVVYDKLKIPISKTNPALRVSSTQHISDGHTIINFHDHPQLDLSSVLAIGDRATVYTRNNHTNNWPNCEVDITAISRTSLTIRAPTSGVNPAYHIALDYGIFELDQHDFWLFFEDKFKGWGDGPCVSSIKTSTNTKISETNYEYSNGTTSYLPMALELASATNDAKQYSFMRELLDVANFLPAPNTHFKKCTVKGRSGNDKSRPLTAGGDSKKSFEFNTFQKEMFSVEYSTPNLAHRPSSTGAPNYWECSNSSVLFKDKTSLMGAVSHINEYDGNGRLVYKQNMKYAYSELDFNTFENIGKITHGYNNAARLIGFTNLATNSNSVNCEKITFSKFVEYPNILMESTTSNKNSVTSTTKYLKYDKFSGQPLMIETRKESGQKVISESLPAYKVLAYGNMSGIGNSHIGMGLPINNPKNKNMLTQQAASWTYEVNQNWTPADGRTNNVVGMLGASAMTWGKYWNYRNLVNGQYQSQPETNHLVWRMLASYGWESATTPDGYLDGNGDGSADFQDFDFATSSPSSKWVKKGQSTFYDRFSALMESWSRGDIYSSSKMGYNNTRLISTASNARYGESTFSGAEDWNTTLAPGYFGGEVTKGPASVVSPASTQHPAHTGSFTLQVPAGQKGFICNVNRNDLTTSSSFVKKYRARVWVHDPANTYSGNALGYAVNSTAQTTPANTVLFRCGAWKLVQMEMDLTSVSANTVISIYSINTSSSTVYFDDFRFDPLQGGSKCFVYDPKTDELRYSLNNDNMYVEYQYDQAGKVVATYVESTEVPSGRKLVSKNAYNYAH